MSWLVKSALVVALVGVNAAIIIPNFVKTKTAMAMDRCQFYCMWIEMAKREWARDPHRRSMAIPTEAAILECMRRITPKWNGLKYRSYAKPDEMPTCYLTDEKYVLGDLQIRVQCPVALRPSKYDDEVLHNWEIECSEESLLRHYR